MDIRKLLNVIAENSTEVKGSSPFSDKLNVMTLDQFLNAEGVLTPEEENLKEGPGDQSKYPDDEEIKEAKLDAPARELGPEELKGYLDRIMGTPVIDPKTGEVKKTPRGTSKYVSRKTKQDRVRLPYVHRSSVVPIVDQDGREYNLEALKTLITKRPTKILKQNEKMQHSDGSASVFYNIGLPALKGLAYDEEGKKFVIIDTCPGAGACQTYCYAMKGGYVQWKNVFESQSQLLNFLYNDPDGFMKRMSDEIAAADEEYNKKDKKTKIVIRWHDAGDFFSPQYLAMAYALAKKHPDVDFYAYTKLASVVQGEKPDNFKINYSMGAKPSEEKKIDFQTTKNSRVVPEVLFKDLLDRDAKGKLFYTDIKALKKRIAAKYSVKPETILTYDEMMNTPQSKDVGKWNVIVKPGDGDDSANRNDVLNTFLLIH